MIGKSNHLILQEHRRRLLFSKSRDLLNLLLFMISSKFSTLLQKHRFNLTLQTNYYSYSSYRASPLCLVSGRSYAVDKSTDLSRFLLRRYVSNGLISGTVRSSW